MNGALFDYAGRTALAWTAFGASLAVALALLALFAFLLLRRKWLWATFPLPLFLAWAVAWTSAGPALDRAWLYLQQNANRSYATYVGLTFATAFLPPVGRSGAGAFNRLAMRDLGFAGGRLAQAWRQGGRDWARLEDEDYPDGVTTVDGRPAATGARFRATRLLTGLIPLFEMPNATSARVVGAEAPLFVETLRRAGLEIRGEEDAAPADIVYVVPGPDWQTGADVPDAAAWRRLSKGLARGGLAALHVDARLLARARLKGVLSAFKEAFGSYRLWCTGRFDYVVTSGGTVLADETLALFARPQAFDAFASAGAVSPVHVFACYVGTDGEVEPGLEACSAWGHARAAWTAPRLAFSDGPAEGNGAPVRPSALQPYEIHFPRWFARGLVERPVYAAVSNAVVGVQGARRDVLLGFDAADAGASTNALARWAAAAKVNPADPLLRGLADSLDLEGRRYLRIGNVNGAMRCYENRLLIWPNDVAAVHNFGVCLKKGGVHDMAARVFAKAVAMDPETDEHRLELVECCAASRREDVACRELEVLMKRHPREPALRLRAARLLALRSNPARDAKRAAALAEEAVRLSGGRDRAYLLALADVYIECGEAARGVQLKRKLKEARIK